MEIMYFYKINTSQIGLGYLTLLLHLDVILGIKSQPFGFVTF